eukprot:SAG31_NODE_3391_length_4326_cov_6.489236_1_plen_101_part_00
MYGRTLVPGYPVLEYVPACSAGYRRVPPPVPRAPATCAELLVRISTPARRQLRLRTHRRNRKIIRTQYPNKMVLPPFVNYYPDLRTSAESLHRQDPTKLM